MLKIILFAVAVVIAAVGVLLFDRTLRARVQRRLSTRPQLTPAAFADRYYFDHSASVARRVKAVLDAVARDLHLDLAGVVPSDTVVADLQFDALDSLSTVDLVVALEKEFGITIPDADAASLRSVGDLVDYVARKTDPRSNANGPASTSAA